MHSEVAPLVSSSVSELRALARAIGVNPQRFDFHPEDVRSIEHFTLEHLAAGNPVYIGSSITSAMQSANAGIFQIMPMLRAEGIEFRHQYFEVVPELAVETPAQAPPNYLEIQESETTATLTRHALGVTATVQELRTAKGQFFFMGKLIYLTVAFVEQAELHAFQALVETPSSYAAYVAKRAAWDIDLARAGRINDDLWDILRRNENGFFVLRDLLEQDFSGKNLRLTHVLMRSGTFAQIGASGFRQEYNRSGPGALERAERLGDSFGDTIGGLQVIVVRPYEYEKKDLRIDPLDRHTIIGAHYRMAPNFHPDCNLDDWCTAYMAIEIYSVNDDEWQRIDVETAINASGRFAPDGRLHEHHEEMVAGWKQYFSPNTRVVPIFDNEFDMFLYMVANDNGEAVVNKTAVFGQMEKWALTDETIMRTVRGIVNYARRSLTPEDLAAIRRGLSDIKELYNLSAGPFELAFQRRSTGLGRFGAPRLPTVAQLNGLAGAANLSGYKPRGYGTVSGYLELATAAGNADLAYIDQQMAQRAVEFSDAAPKLQTVFTEIFDRCTHPALTASFAPQSFRVNSATQNGASINESLNFLHNVVDQNKAVLVFAPDAATNQVGVAGTAGAVTAEPLPIGSPYRPYAALLQAYPSPDVASVFRNTQSLADFERTFASSSIGAKYAEYLRTNRPPVSEDGDQAAAVAAAADGGPLFQQFLENEVATRAGDLPKVAALARIIRIARGVESAPRSVNTKWLRGLSADTSGDLRRDTEAAEPVRGSRATGLAMSVDAYQASAPEYRRDVQFSSPVTPGQVIDIANIDAETLSQLDRSGNPTRLTLFSNASINRIEAGQRGDIEPLCPPGTFQGEQAPSFAYAQFVDLIGAEPVENENLKERYAMFGNMADWLTRIAGQMFLLAPVMRQTFESFARKDIPLPVSFLLEQFNRRYVTSSMIFISHNPDAPVGNIYFLDPDMHVGRDAIRKTIFYHMTMYLGAVINDPRRYIVAHDVAVIGYMGGENAQPFDQDSFNPKALDLLGEDGPSILFFMEPAHVLIGAPAEIKVPQTHDIRGYSARLGNARGVMSGKERPHHPSAAYYTTKLHLDEIKTPSMRDWFEFARLPGVYNTVTHQGTQRMIDTNSRKFENYLHAHDQFGTAVGPGSRKLRTSALPAMYDKPEPRHIIAT